MTTRRERTEPRARTKTAVGNGRDLRLLGSLAWAGYLTTSQVARLHFPSRRTAQRRLRALLDHRLIKAHLQGPAVHIENLYTLTARGVARLESKGANNVAPSRAPRPQKLAHGLAVRDVFLAVRVAEAAGLFVLEDFRFDDDLAKEPLFRSAGLVPDGLALLQVNDHRHVLGCEVDLGTETARFLRAKLASWASLLSSRALGDASLLLLAPSPARLCNIDRLRVGVGCPGSIILGAELAADPVAAFSRLFARPVRAARTGSELKGEGSPVLREGNGATFRIFDS